MLACLSATTVHAQKPAALPPGVVAQGDHYVSQSDGAEMVYVPPGECVIGLLPGNFPGADGSLIETGAKPAGGADLSASHVRVVGKDFFKGVPAATNILVNGFFIDKHEVSNRRYKKFMDATKRPAPTLLPPFNNGYYVAFSWPNNSWYASPDPIYDGADYPVAYVTWDDAAAYAKWAGKMLPTEIQWEKAARGTNTWAYPWGDQWNPDNVNTVERGDRATRPCGTTTNDKSIYGVMDMAGNVSEWTADVWSDSVILLPSPPVGTNAPAAAVTTNAVPASAANTNALHVIKGGHWGYIGFVQSRTWTRRSNADEAGPEPGPVPQSVAIGFRCVIPAP